MNVISNHNFNPNQLIFKMKTIRKTTMMKLATTVVAMFFALNGLMAQVANADYVETVTVDYVTLKTGGTTMGYYALPDPVYHPNYNAGGGWALTADFVWNWTIGGGATVNKPGAANYVEILYPATGDYVLEVTEEASAAFGGCVSGTVRTINVTVIDPPTALFTTADNLANCGDLAAQPIEIAITEQIALALAGYSFRVRELIENIDAVGNPAATVNDDATFVDFGLAAKVQNGTAGFAGSQPDYTYGFNSSALNVVAGARTRYTYELTSAAGVTGAGIVSAISHKSDYLAGQVNGFAFGAKTTVVFIVNPAPVTGPIYHIPNTFNL